MLKDILEESWAYKEMVESATEKGIEKGKKEALNSMRETVLHFVRRMYPQFEAQTRQYIHQIEDTKQLGAFMNALIDAQSSEEVAQLFTQH